MKLIPGSEVKLSGFVACEDLEAGFLRFKKRGGEVTAIILRDKPINLKTWSKKSVRVQITIEVLNKGVNYGKKNAHIKKAPR